MSTTNIVIGVAVGVLFAAAIILWRNRYRDVFGALLVLGIAALAVVVTIAQVATYRHDEAVAAAAASRLPVPPDLVTGPRPKPMVDLRAPQPRPEGLTGSAVPPAAEDPYAGGSR